MRLPDFIKTKNQANLTFLAKVNVIYIQGTP